MSSILAPPLGRLADDLSNLRVRVREAMASEVARAVGEAAREAVALALGRGEHPPRPAPPARQAPEWGGHGPGPGRGDDPDPWGRDPRWHDVEDDWGGTQSDAPPHRDPVPPAPDSPLRRGGAALAAGWGAGHWWFSRRGSLPEAVAVGVLAALAALAGGDAARR